jgi:hypothetical protein
VLAWIATRASRGGGRAAVSRRARVVAGVLVITGLAGARQVGATVARVYLRYKGLETFLRSPRDREHRLAAGVLA